MSTRTPASDPPDAPPDEPTPPREPTSPSGTEALAEPGSRTLRNLLATEAASGFFLLIAAVVALVWANSPWKDTYETVWHTEVELRIGSFVLEHDLRHWVNDALMTLFFFVVGLEIKRELVEGHLRDWRHASLPVAGAIGGMVVPALLYTAFNLGGPGASGWGVPMATDIAFAVGVMSLMGPRVPSSLKVFLLSLAVVDDIGGIVVIAIFYSSGIDPVALAAAGMGLVLVVAMRRLGITAIPLYVVVGAGVWLATSESGIHATIAGVVLGLLTPAHPVAPTALIRQWSSTIEGHLGPEDTRALVRAAQSTLSVVERLEGQLAPFTGLLIVPLFALANAGVTIDSNAFALAGSASVALGIAVGLVIGKPVGITLAVLAAVRLGIGSLQRGVSMLHIAAAGAVGGIGFTVALFIAELAFEDDLGGAAKIGILSGSLLASVIGAASLRAVTRVPSG